MSPSLNMRSLKKDKKAQITVFIIVGIILLFSSALIFYIRSQVEEQRVIPAGEPKVAEVPEQFVPIRMMVTECLTKLSADAVRLIAENGGYIDSSRFYTIPDQPTESQALSIFGTKVPYWHYLASNNRCSGNCRFESLQPLLEKEDDKVSIQQQIEDYILENFDSCVNDFQDFRQQGFEFELGEKSMISTLADKDVRFLLNYPIKASRPGEKASMDSFYVNLPVKLKQIYDTASVIANTQKEHRVLEWNTIELMNLFSQMDKNMLPPKSRTIINKGAVIWSVASVKDKIEALLLSYIPLFQVTTADNYQKITVASNEPQRDLVQSMYDRMTFVYPQSSGLDVTFNYFGEPIYFNMNDGAAVVKPDSIYVPFPIPISLHKYQNTYDLSYPVLIEVIDKDAPENLFGPQGLSFKFALEASMMDNSPTQASYYKNEMLEEPQESVFCDEANWQSANITFNITDTSNRPIRDAQISFTAGASCFLGITDSKGTLVTNSPKGYGLVNIIAPLDYIGRSVEAYIGDEEKTIKINLTPVFEMNATVHKFILGKISRNNYEYSSLPVSPLRRYEDVSILLERVGEDGEEEFMSALIINGNESQFDTIRLAPGKYNARANIMYYDPFTIEPQYRCSGGGGLFSDEECYYVPEEAIVFGQDSPFMDGGFLFDETTQLLDIHYGNLLLSDYVIFKVLSFGVGDNSQPEIEDIEEPNNLEKYTMMYSQQIKPEFKEND